MAALSAWEHGAPQQYYSCMLVIHLQGIRQGECSVVDFSEVGKLPLVPCLEGNKKPTHAPAHDSSRLPAEVRLKAGNTEY